MMPFGGEVQTDRGCQRRSKLGGESAVGRRARAPPTLYLALIGIFVCAAALQAWFHVQPLHLSAAPVALARAPAVPPGPQVSLGSGTSRVAMEAPPEPSDGGGSVQTPAPRAPAVPPPADPTAATPPPAAAPALPAAQEPAAEPTALPLVVPAPRERRGFIVFMHIKSQGAGNNLNGLLSAHLLAREYGRTVCVTPEWTEFSAAFESKDSVVRAECPQVLAALDSRDPKTHRRNGWAAPGVEMLSAINYKGGVDECEFHATLSDPAARVVIFMANTYPRWPHTPPNFFSEHYSPTAALLATLPWRPEAPPKHVVHLRQGDGGEDKRNGLDETTFRLLGEVLPSDTFLVTNSVPWYDLFAKNYTWAHPPWHEVWHSYLGDRGWGAAGGGVVVAGGGGGVSKVEGTLQLFSDWYTLAMAEKVWHTFSDFSFSACHWQGMECHTIKGVEEGKLALRDPTWVMSGEKPWLSQRTREEKICRA